MSLGVLFLEKYIATPKASGPSLPIYMRNIINNFPTGDSVDVIPVLNPTVPKAEAASKRISFI